MASITLFFAHQPDRLRPHESGRILRNIPEDRLHEHFFDNALNESIFKRVAEKCYYPASRLLLELIQESRTADKPFRFSFGLSGLILDQAERYDPALIDVFRDLMNTGMVELTGETYFHSLASLFNSERVEFKEQALMHSDRLEALFGVRPAFFRNTECLYNDGIAESVKEMGFKGILTEGVDWLLAEGGRTSDALYRAKCGLPVLLRNHRLSDDIGYRFSDKGWIEWPLNAATFAEWLASCTEANIVLAMDFEAFGEHMWEETGILEFLRRLPAEVAKHPGLSFTTPMETIRNQSPAGEISVGDFKTISWADSERDTSAWLGNEMQMACFSELKEMESRVKSAGSDREVDVWRRMLTSDHLYYLATKSSSDEDVHRYFSAYGSAAEGFVRVFSAIADFSTRLKK